MKHVENGILAHTAQAFLCSEANDATPAAACGSACGAGDEKTPEPKPEEKPAACGSACGAGEK